MRSAQGTLVACANGTSLVAHLTVDGRTASVSSVQLRCRAALHVAAFTLLTSSCLVVPKELAAVEEPSAPGSVPAPTTAEDVLAAFVRALGGEPALRRVEQRRVDARVVVLAQEGCKVGDETCVAADQIGSFLIQSTAAGQLYQRTVVGPNVEEHGFDGTTGWVLLGDGVLRLDPKAEAELSREEALLHWYLDVEKRGIEVGLLSARTEDSAGTPMTLDGLSWRLRGKDLVRELWFERESGLLWEEIQRTSSDTEHLQIIHYDDYRKLDGVAFAGTIRVTNRLGDRAQTLEFIAQRADHAPVDAKIFAVPQLPAPEPKRDPLLIALDAATRRAASLPGESEAQMDWARVAFKAGHFVEAERACQAALAIQSKEPEALWMLGRIEIMHGAYKAARQHLHEAQKAGVKDSVIAREQAWIHHRLGQFDAMASALEQAGNAAEAQRFRAFVGRPLEIDLERGQCSIAVELVARSPLAVASIQVGQESVHAILDSGAGDLIIGQTLAAKLGVSIHSKVRVAEGTPEVGYGQIEAMNLGDLRLRNVPVAVFDDRSLAQMAGGDASRPQAVVGLGLLHGFLVALDIPAGKVEIVPGSSRCAREATALRRGPAVPLWLHETHYLYALAEMNGAEGLYLLNTGMRGADMTANGYANAYAGIGTPVVEADMTPLANVRTFEFVDGAVAENVSSAYGMFMQTQTADGFRLDGMIGLGVLGRRAFVLDFEHLRLHFPPPDGP